MGLEKVVANIRSEGRAQADATVAQARREAAEILADARRQADEIRAKRGSQATAEAESLSRRETASADLEARRLRLAAERELVGSIRADVEKRLAALPEAQRVAHVQALIRKANIANGRVLVSKKDEAAVRKAGVNVAGTFDGLGGVVVESPDGATRENLRYETLLDEIWTTTLPQVAGKLLKA